MRGEEAKYEKDGSKEAADGPDVLCDCSLSVSDGVDRKSVV